MVLGWSLRWKKSDFIPKQQTTHLGFVVDSVSITVSYSSEKIARLQSSCRNLMVAGVVLVHDAEGILGTMESKRPVTPLCVLHYRAFKKQLLKAKAFVRYSMDHWNFRLNRRVFGCLGTGTHKLWPRIL